MDESRDYLAKIYEHLRYQQEMIFALTTGVLALESLLSSIPGYEDRRAAALTEAAAAPNEFKHTRHCLQYFLLRLRNFGGKIPRLRMLDRHGVGSCCFAFPNHQKPIPPNSSAGSE